MKKFYSLILLLLVFSMICMVSCGNLSYSGTWYNSSDPDGKVLILTKDGKFSYGEEVAGNYSVQDDCIIFETTTAGFESETMTIIDGDYSDTCLLDTDGAYWYKDYDVANNIYMENEEEEQNSFDNTVKALIEYFPGKWVAYYDDGSKDAEFTINEDYTWEGIDYGPGDQEDKNLSGIWEFKKEYGYTYMYRLKLCDENGYSGSSGTPNMLVNINDYIDSYNFDYLEIDYGIFTKLKKQSNGTKSSYNVENGDIIPIKASATSVLKSQKENVYSARMAYDGKNNTAWVEGVKGSGVGEEITFTIGGKASTIKGINILNGYCKNETVYFNNNRIKKVKCSFDDGKSEFIYLDDIFGELQSYSFDSSHTTKSVTLRIMTVYTGSLYDDTCLTDVTFY